MNYRPPTIQDGDIWDSPKGFEGMYQVSNWGNVRSLNRNIRHPKGGLSFRSGQVLRIVLDKYGYPKVVLQKEGRRRYFTVHRLVAEVFVPNPNNLPQVNHIDGDKTNNYYENLEWISALDNQLHAIDKGLKTFESVSGTKHYNSTLSVKDILNIRKRLNQGEKGVTLANEYKVSKSTISRIKLKQAYKDEI